MNEPTPSRQHRRRRAPGPGPGLALAGRPVLAQGPPLAPPVIALDVEPAKPEVGQEVTVSWQVSGAVSVSVRRDAQQVSTDAAGERSFTVADKRPITWAVAASNRAGASPRK